MFEEIEENGVVYLVNKQTGEKIVKPPTANEGFINQTPLASQQSAITNNAVQSGNQLKGALAKEATALKSLYDERTATVDDATKRMNELTPPQAVEPITLPDFTDRDAYMKENDVTFPDPNDPKYQVNKEDYEPEVDKTKRIGKMLMAAGAMFKELGNPQLYKGEINQATEMIYLMNENEKEEARENYADALTIAETAYNNDKVMYDHHMDILDAKDDAVQQEIERIKIINQDKKDIFSQNNTVYTNQINAIQREIDQADNTLEINANKLAIDPNLISNFLKADVDIGKALKQEIDLLNSIENLAGAKTQNLIDVKDTWNGLFSSNSENFGLPYESKLEMVKGMATNDISQKFVELLPPDEATFLRNRTMEIMSNANQMLGVADMLGLSSEMGEALMMERALGINTDFSFNKEITDPLAYTPDQIEGFINQSDSGRSVYEQASMIQQKINSGEYSASGIEKFITDSKFLNVLASIGEATGLDTNIQGRFEDLKAEVGGAEKALASLVTELIPKFTGDTTGRKTTFDVTYTGESLGSLKQMFEQGKLQTNEGQLRALEIIKDLAKETAIKYYKKAEEGRPQEPDDQFFADIDKKYSSTTTSTMGGGDPMTEEEMKTMDLIVSKQDLQGIKDMFAENNVGQKLLNPANAEYKQKLMRDIKAKFPNLPPTELDELLKQLFGG